MNINNIEMPLALVADIYHNFLITTEEEYIVSCATAPPSDAGPARTDIPETVWKWLGNNQKNILIIVSNKETVFLPDNELTFLTGVLGACKLTLADVAIVNLYSTPQIIYKELISHYKSKVVLLFNVEPVAFGLPMSFPPYQIQPFAGNSFLFAPSLKSLENDKVEKSKLWVCLKRLFNL